MRMLMNWTLDHAPTPFIGLLLVTAGFVLGAVFILASAAFLPD